MHGHDRRSIPKTPDEKWESICETFYMIVIVLALGVAANIWYGN